MTYVDPLQDVSVGDTETALKPTRPLRISKIEKAGEADMHVYEYADREIYVRGGKVIAIKSW